MARAVKRAFAVVDLGFGDAGKGALTDALARRHDLELVVRFNGGAQAGHNVVTPDGRHHTFAQVGAASFVHPRVRTLLSRFVVVHPTALLVEARSLGTKGVPDVLDRVLLDERALVTTPYHQAAARIRERARGAARHGSCGVGVGETVADALAEPATAVFAGHLRDPVELRRRLALARERMRRAIAALAEAARDADELAVFANAGEAWIDASCTLARNVLDPRATTSLVRRADGVVFEGAQGVLLDEDHGFHPHTTWSRCTFANAVTLAREVALDVPLERIGLLRAYAVRHGAGPFPTEDRALPVTERHNATGPWQGAVRVGHLDLVLLRYALAACGDVDALAVSHVDALRPAHRVAVAYRGALDEHARERDQGGAVVRLANVTNLEAAERLGRALATVAPVLAPLADPVAVIERATERPILAVGRGPTAAEWKLGPVLRT
jgi:adenylosuccinate synthase